MNEWMLLLVFAAGCAAAAWAGFLAGRAVCGRTDGQTAAPVRKEGRGAHSAGRAEAETEDERRARIIAENIENYGTSAPQAEVE